MQNSKSLTLFDDSVERRLSNSHPAVLKTLSLEYGNFVGPRRL